MEKHGHPLASQKTEVVVLTRHKCIERPLRAEVDGHEIVAVATLKFLGIMLDGKLTFWPHLLKAADKVGTMFPMLSRLMPNIAGHRYSKRRLLMRVTQFILLYGAEA